jgi:D-alanine--poly(phosphoribitol) ligase subunit 1
MASTPASFRAGWFAGNVPRQSPGDLDMRQENVAGGLVNPDVLVSWLAHARSDRNRLVVTDGTRQLDQGGLVDEVESLAASLTERGVGPGDRVALQLPNSADFLVAALACLWIGAVFIPLAVTDPPARVSALISDCRPVLILANSGVVEPHPRALEIGSVRRTGLVPGELADPRRLDACAMYTSGSTGKPKAVMISRQGLAAAVTAVIYHLRLDCHTRALCVSPVDWDGSFATLFPTLAAGGSLVVPPAESLLFARFFLRTIAREGVTYTGFSPSYLRRLLADPKVGTLTDSTLSIIALGGESCSGADVAALSKIAPGIRVFNRYGPTETTIAVTHFEVTPEVVARGGPVPIGQPHDGVSFHLVDEEGNEILGVREVGELYIGGLQLMSGYWGDPDLTESVMRSDLIEKETVYRTGDLAVRDEAGDYVYIDRADRVVKRNGLRISLVELADVLRSAPGVSAATCVAFDNDGSLGIAAFVVADGGETPVDLRRAAGLVLPAVMLPDLITIVAELPLTPANKVDERRLLSDAGLHAIQRISV